MLYKPILAFDNLPNDNIIKASLYSFSVRYTQAQGAKLDYVTINLYDSNKSLINTSNKLYSTLTPPLSLSYTFDGLINNEQYYIQAECSTLNGVKSNTDYIPLTVSYEIYALEDSLKLTNMSRLGYELVESKIFVTSQTSDKPLVYIDNEYLDLGDNDLLWYKGFEVPENFVLTIKMRPTQLGMFCQMWSTNKNNNISLDFVRERPYDSPNEIKDCFTFISKIDGNEVAYKKSNYVPPMNNTSNILVFVRKVGTDVTCILRVLSQENNRLVWNRPDLSNVEYNAFTDIAYLGEETDYPIASHRNQYVLSDINELFPITNVYIRHGIYDFVDITQNTAIVEPLEEMSWDEFTILHCDFNGHVGGGNIQLGIDELKAIKIKRRLKGELSWVTIWYQPVYNYDDLEFAIKDSMMPSNNTYEWALVPIDYNNVEALYIIKEDYVVWDGIFLSNRNVILKLYEGVALGTATQNRDIGVLQPIGRMYPYVIRNGMVNYKSGSVSGDLYGYNYEETRIIDPKDVIKQREDFLELLKYPFCLTDWNGNAWIVIESDSPEVSFTNPYGNTPNRISVNFVEQGKWDNSEDLVQNGFVKEETYETEAEELIYSFECPDLYANQTPHREAMELWQTLLKGNDYENITISGQWDNPTYLATLDYKKKTQEISALSENANVTQITWSNMIKL